MRLLWICIYASIISSVTSSLTFHGHKVIQVQLETEEHVKLIKRMDKEFQFDFWHPDSSSRIAPKMNVDLHIHANHTDNILQRLKLNNIQFEILFHDLQTGIEAQLDNRRFHKSKKHSYMKYNDWETIAKWMSTMAAKHSDLVSQLKIGETYEGRPMYVLRVGQSSPAGPAIFMDCGIHAREWISPAFCQWFVRETSLRDCYMENNQYSSMTPMLGQLEASMGHRSLAVMALISDTCHVWKGNSSGSKFGTTLMMCNNVMLVSGYSKDEETKKLLTNLNFYILPVLNVDGYVHTWTKDRMWRKSRSPTPDCNCFGADLNRNFNISWCDIGASDEPCSEIYCGESAQSEIEALNVANFILSNLKSIKSYISIHAYAQMILYPYSYTYDLAPNTKELDEISKGAASKLYSLYKTEYVYGPSASTIYPTSGSSDDWAYSQGIQYSFTLELRDTGDYGFLLPEKQIKATCKETTAAIIYIANYVLSHST